MPFAGNSSYKKTFSKKELAKDESGYEARMLKNIKTRQREGNAIPKASGDPKFANMFNKTTNKVEFAKRPIFDKVGLIYPLDDVRAPFEFPNQFSTTNNKFMKGKQPHWYPQYETTGKTEDMEKTYQKHL
jgi:hypothetical protein